MKKNKPMLVKLELPVCGIVVTLNVTKGGGKIKSELKEEFTDDNYEKNKEVEKWNQGVDVLESIVLAHAIAGVDIMSNAYTEGLETAIDAMSNNVE